MNTGREHDIEELITMYHRATSDSMRRNIYETALRIRNESGAVKEMREALIRAHRDGDIDEIKDIHDYIRNKDKYK